MFYWVINTPLVLNFVLTRYVRNYRWEGGGRSALPFFPVMKFTYESNFSLNMLFFLSVKYIGNKSPNFSLRSLFLRAMQIKCFSKCHCFKKRPLPQKIHGYATARSRSFLEFPNRIELLKTLLKLQEFPAQEFLQNDYCLELLKVCEIFFIFDSVIFSITSQKNITCQK